MEEAVENGTRLEKDRGGRRKRRMKSKEDGERRRMFEDGGRLDRRKPEETGQGWSRLEKDEDRCRTPAKDKVARRRTDETGGRPGGGRRKTKEFGGQKRPEKGR